MARKKQQPKGQGKKERGKRIEEHRKRVAEHKEEKKFKDGRGRPYVFGKKKQKVIGRVIERHDGNATQTRKELLAKGYSISLPTVIRIGKRLGIDMRKRGRPEE